MVEHRRGPYTISTAREKLDVALVHDYLSQRSYWATGRPLEVVRRSMAAGA